MIEEKYVAALVCGNPGCEDGAVDSGGVDPGGRGIDLPCPECAGRGWVPNHPVMERWLAHLESGDKAHREYVESLRTDLARKNALIASMCENSAAGALAGQLNKALVDIERLRGLLAEVVEHGGITDDEFGDHCVFCGASVDCVESRDGKIPEHHKDCLIVRLRTEVRNDPVCNQ